MYKILPEQLSQVVLSPILQTGLLVLSTRQEMEEGS